MPIERKFFKVLLAKYFYLCQNLHRKKLYDVFRYFVILKGMDLTPAGKREEKVWRVKSLIF